MNIYWYLNGLSYSEKLEKLKNSTPEALISMIINERYNSFLAQYADFEKEELPVDETVPNGREFGKRLPYHGWFWRSVDFYSKKVPVGIGESIKGFMVSNKWYYPEGVLNDDQFIQIMEIIDRAMKLSEAGGDLSQIRKNTLGELEKLWPLLQSFTIVVDY